MALVDDLVQEVIREASMVAGTAVQIYSEETIIDKLWNSFSTVFDLELWPDYRFDLIAALDGTTGTITTDISTLAKRFQDINKVFPGTANTPLAQLPVNFNMANVTGTTARYIGASSDPRRVFKVYPVTATGNVTIVGKTRPTKFTAGDTHNIGIDDRVLVYGAAWQLTSSDAVNPNEIDRLSAQFEARLSQLRMSLHDHPILLDDRTSGNLPTEWREYA